MPFLLHTIWREIAFFLFMRSSLLFADNSQSPPQSPYPDTVPLRLFQILRFFLIHWLIGQFASDWFVMLNLVFPSDILFSLSSCCITATLQRERCWKVCWWEASISDGHLCWPHWVYVRTPYHMSFAFHHWTWPSLFSQLFSTSTQARLKEYFSLAILWSVFCRLYKDTIDSNVHLWDMSFIYNCILLWSRRLLVI